MSISGDHEVLLDAAVAAGDEVEAKAAGYRCTERSRPANWSRFTLLGVPLVVAMVLVVVVVVILVSMRASVDPPFLPSFTVVSFTVRSLSLGAAASGEFSVTLAVRNPNTRADVRFRALVAGVYYGGMVVGEARLPPMYQAALTERTVTSRLVAGSGIAWPPDMARGGDVIRFRLEATCSVAFRRVDGVEETGARWRKLVVRCGDVPIQLDNTTAPPISGELVGTMKPCSVE